MYYSSTIGRRESRKTSVYGNYELYASSSSVYYSASVKTLLRSFAKFRNRRSGNLDRPRIFGRGDTIDHDPYDRLDRLIVRWMALGSVQLSYSVSLTLSLSLSRSTKKPAAVNANFGTRAARLFKRRNTTESAMQRNATPRAHPKDGACTEYRAPCALLITIWHGTYALRNRFLRATFVVRGHITRISKARTHKSSDM